MYGAFTISSVAKKEPLSDVVLLFSHFLLQCCVRTAIVSVYTFVSDAIEVCGWCEVHGLVIWLPSPFVRHIAVRKQHCSKKRENNKTTSDNGYF